MNSVKHIKKGSDTLVIVFSGFYKAIQNTSFEWSLLQSFDVDILYVMDDKQRWYLKGIKEVSTSVVTTRRHLDMVSKGYSKVIYLGASMGGYAAVLFGSLSKHKNVHIHAFSPQINLMDYGYTPLIKDKSVKGFKRYHNLVKACKIPKETVIYYGINNKRDHTQISVVECVKVLYDTEEHRIPKYLKDRDELMDLLDRIIY